MYKSSDSVNRPQIIGTTFKSKKNIGRNQTENWTLIRLFPLLVSQAIPPEDPVWLQVLLLKNIVELVYSPSLTEGMILVLEKKS